MSDTFRIGVYEEQSGSVIVTANSKEEAEAKVQTLLEEDGLEGLEDYKLWASVCGVASSVEL